MNLGFFGAASCAVLFGLVACSSDDDDAQTGDPVSTAGSGGGGKGAATGGQTTAGGSGGATGGTSGADCSECPASALADCNSLGSECIMAGETLMRCQEAIAVFCALADSFPDGGVVVVGEPCGDTTCPVGTECCNPLMGICVMPGMVCIQ